MVSKNVKRKIIVVIAILSIWLAISSCMTSCILGFRNHQDKSIDFIVSGDFTYSKRKAPEGAVIITGLSEEGKEKETLVFPSVIDGYRVHSVKMKDGLKGYRSIVVSKAKNIYFPSGYVQTNGLSYKPVSSITDMNIYIADDDTHRVYYPSPSSFPSINYKLFVSEKYYKTMEKIYGMENVFEQKANVIYYIDKDTQHFIDDANGTTVHVIPPIPYKEGYEFLGWYKDLKYSEKWDFEKDKVPHKIYDKDGDYVFVETKIYAKWKKIEEGK